jgi:hypothetical protein
MDFKSFFEKCRHESTVSDFESYLAHCILEKKATPSARTGAISVEQYTQMRDQAFDLSDERAAQTLYSLAGASDWKEGDWEGALR